MMFTVGEQIDYLPGDALEILPKNLATDVNSLILQMGWTEHADAHVELAPTRFGTRLSQYISLPLRLSQRGGFLTLRDLLMEYLDITAIPRRSFFSKIASYADDESHKDRILEFADPSFLDEYFDYATRPRRSILEVMQEFDSVRIPWQDIVNIFPVLRPRQFSIASGGILKHSLYGGTTFELLVAIVKYRTVIKKIREGVCTRYLATLSEGSLINVVLRTEGRFHARYDLNVQHHLLIGTGTGIAPLRSLIYEKALSLTAKPATVLVFGSRSATSDFFFSTEWSDINSRSAQTTKHPSFRVITAFSRDQKAKVYVQDRIRENSSTIYDLLCNKSATVVVCGSSGQMPRAVREALVDALISPREGPEGSHGPATRLEAEAYLGMMEKEGRYKQETW